jgi:hypothetical protein
MAHARSPMIMPAASLGQAGPVRHARSIPANHRASAVIAHSFPSSRAAAKAPLSAQLPTELASRPTRRGTVPQCSMHREQWVALTGQAHEG